MADSVTKSFSFKPVIPYVVGVVTIALGVAAGFWLNELRTKAKTVAPAKKDA